MPYRLTNRAADVQARMRAGRERARMDRPAPDYPPILPDLRRRIVIEDFDFGHRIHVLELHKTARNKLLARLHCIRRDQGWSEDEYRDILEARTGRRSAGDLDERTIARLVASLDPKAAQKSAAAGRRHPPHEWTWVDTAPEHKRSKLRKLIMLAKGAGIAKGRQVAWIEGIALRMAAPSWPRSRSRLQEPAHSNWLGDDQRHRSILNARRRNQ